MPDILEWSGPEAVLNGNVVSIDVAMQHPDYLRRKTAQIAEQGLWIQDLFSRGPKVVNGGLLFERPNPLATDLYASRDVKTIAESGEAPVVTFERGVPMLARAIGLGGKFKQSKLARNRNDPQKFNTAVTRLGQTIQLRLEKLGMAESAAVIQSEGRYGNGTSWATYAGTNINTRTGTLGPLSDIITYIMRFETESYGLKPDTLVINPAQAISLAQAFQGQDFLKVLQAVAPSIKKIRVTQRQAAGTAMLFASGQYGTWRDEFAYYTKQWLNEETEDRWFEARVYPLFAVTNPMAAIEIRGIA